MVIKLIFIILKKMYKILTCSKRLYGMKKLSLTVLLALIITLAFTTLYSTLFFLKLRVDDHIPINLMHTQQLVEDRLMEYYMQEKGKGCNIPKVDPFSVEAMKFVSFKEKIRCKGNDWVICNKSECYVKKEFLNNMNDVTCSYRDIVYVNDSKYFISDYTLVSGSEKYKLNKSDHVTISCSGKQKSFSLLYSRWSGVKAGFRPVKTMPVPPDRKDSYNVVFLGFDSASHNGFIRKMQKSYKFLAERAVILNGYNIVGDGTPAALYPILTGMSEYEHPDARKKITENVFVNHESFIFHQLKDYGYRTAYFEDTPSVGTFQYRFNGFRQQPADHYLRAFLLEHEKNYYIRFAPEKYCVGDIPQYQLFLNLTNEFLQLDGKKFGFTFIADICHDDFNLIGSADEDVAWFLESLAERRVFDDTLVIVMGDHGSRFENIRKTYQGKLEERLPLMAIMLPEKLKQLRPYALASLQQNRNVLTTPFDIHNTILDVLNLKDKINKYKVLGADLPRALTLLEPIPKSRTCPEAGIVQHWCTCTKWANVSHAEMYKKVAFALADFIDSISNEQRKKCARRRLIAIKWVLQLVINNQVLSYGFSKEEDAYLGNSMLKPPRALREYYQAKITLSPGKGLFEGTLAYNTKTDTFIISKKDISRVSKYGKEPDCISATHPHLNPFCYCVRHNRTTKMMDFEDIDGVIV